MANSEVKVALTPGIVVTLATDNPNIDDLVKAIVDNRDGIDVGKIEVFCEKDSFDVESFTEVIRDSCSAFLGSLKLEKESFETVLLTLDSQS